MVTLSIRLAAIAARVPASSRLADIGSDHALLPVYLAEQGKLAAGIAGEVNPGPYEAARRQVRESGVEDRIEVRKGDGLAVLAPGEVDVITIAGMGGGLIVSILEAGADRLAGVRLLVLQPNVGEDQVRRYLLANDWLLAAEEILEEDGKIYEILTAERHPDARRLNAELYRERTITARAGENRAVAAIEPGTSGTVEAGTSSKVEARAGENRMVTAIEAGTSCTVGAGASGAAGANASSCCALDRDGLLRFGPFLAAAGGEVFHRKWQRELAKWERVERQLAESALSASAARREEVQRGIAKIKEVLACT